MAFLHCHQCGWSQDDFWDPEEYNPFRQDLIENLKEMLFKDKIYLDRFILEDMDLPVRIDDGGCYALGKEYVARKLELKAASIRGMVYPTYESAIKAREEGTIRCPSCGSEDELDID